MPLVLSEVELTFEIETAKGKASCYQAVDQLYKRGGFSAGLVEGIEPDTLYLRVHPSKGDEITLLLRPDEIQAIVWVCAGALWSHEMLEEKKKKKMRKMRKKSRRRHRKG